MSEPTITINTDGFDEDPNLRHVEDINPLLRNAFKMQIDGLPRLTFSCTKCAVPAVSIGTVEQPVGRFGGNVKMPGGSVTYNPLSLSFIVDENLKNYREIRDWMEKTVSFSSYENYEPNTSKHFRDLLLYTTNSARIPNLRIFFRGAFPKSLGDVDLSSMLTATEPVSVAAVFMFTTLDFETV